MTLQEMPKGVVGDQSTKLLAPFTAGTDTVITVSDVSVLPDATSSAPNYASVRMPNKSCLVTFSYTGKSTSDNKLSGITILESDTTAGLTTTYPVGSKVYWSITKVLLDHIIDNVTVGGGSGSNDYTSLINKPQINSVELNGNKTSSALGLASSTELTAEATTRASNDALLQSALGGKVDEYQGTANVGKAMVVGSDGNLYPQTITPTGVTNWGDIGGNIELQTDLVAEFDKKVNKTYSTVYSGKVLGIASNGNVVPVAPSGGVTWGEIGGTLSSQTDLNSALSQRVRIASDSENSSFTLGVDENNRLYIVTGN